MWYPLMLIVFQRGSRSAQYAKVSVTSRIDGRGGKMYVPRAAYSLRMSFWIVPPSVVGGDALALRCKLVRAAAAPTQER